MSKTHSEMPIIHPKKGEHGEAIIIKHPTESSDRTTWHDSHKSAVFVPNGDTPSEINGIQVQIWGDAPRMEGDWEACGLVEHELSEPPIGASNLPWASGVVIVEPDGRIWMVSPTNKFGGYETTFPKGKIGKSNLTLQANAIKECHEESGLKARITGFLGDFKRTTSTTRLYLGERVGGDPVDMGWESQAVRLVPRSEWSAHLLNPSDEPVLKALLKLLPEN